ncbi:MAG: TIM barrel protein [Bacteroidales bacterium]|nr:TIM barrel protein [Bacteroidales bacterium]
MNRRKFLLNASLAAGSAGLMGFNNASASVNKSAANGFQLLYAPHFGMFKNSAGADLVDQLNFIHERGFRAMEDNSMKKRSLADQERVAKTMSKLDMKMGVFVAHTIDWKETTLASGDEEKRATFLKEIKESVEVAKRVNAKWMTVVPGHVDLGQNIDFQTAHVVETLKRASEILEPHGLIMVLEPLNFRNHPGLFLKRIPQAFQVCKAVDSPSCKILFDIYHQQIQEGNLIPNMDLAWDEVAYFQCGDNPGRKEPTTGEINYLNVFKHIYEKGGTDMIVGMEHGNSKEGKEGEEAVIAAYREVDDF